MKSVDPITLEVVRNSLLTVAAQMKIVVKNSAFATLWREAGDLSCAILDKDANLVAQGPADIPVHLATMPYSLRGALEKMGADKLKPGDMLLHNCPEYGNNHLPDCLLAKPIFHEGRLIAFSAVRGHWTDIGGIGPGSLSVITTDAYQEGLKIPPIKIYKEGKLDNELLDLILFNVRNKEERMGDFMAQYSGCVIGERNTLEIVEKYGVEVVLDCFEAILDQSERLTRAEIEKIPDGESAFTVYGDGDGVTDELIKIQVKVTVSGSDVLVDFAGSHHQTIGGMNSPVAVTASATLFAMKAITDPWNPPNSGSYRPVRVIAPEGTIVNPCLPAPVYGSNGETSLLIIDAIFGAFLQICPERVTAAGSGTTATVAFAGVDNRPHMNNRPFIYREPHGSAWGARYSKDGVNGMRVGCANVGNTPVEVVELEYPIQILEYSLADGKGGEGKHRGGLPVRRVYRLLTQTTFSFTGEHCRTAPHGLLGGKDGKKARYLQNPGTKTEFALFSKVAPTQLEAGVTILIESAGGGGFGQASERNPELVRFDELNGYMPANKSRKAPKRKRKTTV